MNRGTLLLGSLGLLFVVTCSCGGNGVQDNDSGGNGLGSVSIRLPLTASDVQRVVATISGAGIATAITKDLTIDGSPRVAHGEIADIPAGSARTVKLEAYPAPAGAPEAAVVIYRGMTAVDISAGQASLASITLKPVNGDVAVTANFPAGDIDVANIDYVEVTVSGNRITTSPKYYLSLDKPNNKATGAASKIPVGLTRTFSVKSYDSTKKLLHQGSADAGVAETGSTVTVTMTNATGAGAVDINGGFCNPDCTSKTCGDDGCGGSCGGCKIGLTCETTGQCQNDLCSAGFPMDLASWQSWQGDSQTPEVPHEVAPGAGVFETTTDGIRITNQLSRRSAYLFTKMAYPLSGKTVRLRWMADGGGCFMGAGGLIYKEGWPNPNVAHGLARLSTGNSYNGSVLISERTWYYTRAWFEGTTWNYVNSSGGYDDQGGNVVDQGTWTLSGTETFQDPWHIGLNDGDPHCAPGTYLELAEAKICP